MKNNPFFSDIDLNDTESCGQCGDNVYWKIIDAVLYIGGSGDMWDFDVHENDEATKRSYLGAYFEEVVILDGVTSIGVNAFFEQAFYSITIPQSVKLIKECAFFNCTIHGTLDLTASLHTVEDGIIASDPCNIDRLSVSVNIPVLAEGAFYTRLGAPKEIVLTGDLPADLTNLVKTQIFEFPEYTRISYPAEWDEKVSFYESISQLIRVNVLTCEGIPLAHPEKYYLNLKKALIPTA